MIYIIFLLFFHLYFVHCQVRCGQQANGATCSEQNYPYACCSASGYCGYGPDNCMLGNCQSECKGMSVVESLDGTVVLQGEPFNRGILIRNQDPVIPTSLFVQVPAAGLPRGAIFPTPEEAMKPGVGWVHEMQLNASVVGQSGRTGETEQTITGIGGVGGPGAVINLIVHGYGGAGGTGVQTIPLVGGSQSQQTEQTQQTQQTQQPQQATSAQQQPQTTAPVQS